MPAFLPAHVEHSGSIELPLALPIAFPIFTPEGERAWVPGWAPTYLHPARPSTAPGTVFTTEHGGEHTLWLILRLEPDRGIAEYARFTPGNRLGTVRVSCVESGPGRTRVRVEYALTALAPAGNDVLSALTPAAYRAMLDEWARLIHASLAP